MDIRSLDITELDVLEDGRIHIKLRRPGILIGPKGNNVLALQEFLGAKLHIEEEPDDTISDEIISVGFDDYDFF